MNREELNEEFNRNARNASGQPKPLRKLKRIDNSRPSQPVYHGLHEAPSIDIAIEEEKPRRRAPEPIQTYHGLHEKGRAGDIVEGADFDDFDDFDDGYSNEKGRKKSKKDAIIKTAAILLSLVTIIVLFLNMPILWYKKKGQPDQKVSIIKYFKLWQPLVDLEGELEKPQTNLNVDSDIVTDDFTDGLDLPQLVEGQYTVLFLGFDEDLELTDVIWICQFDIAAAKLHILQVPRDCAVPNYTSNPTTKINSVYYEGYDQDVSKIQRVVNCIQDNFGIPIDAYITTACYDIRDIVDLVGGVTMDIDNEIIYEADKRIPAGKNVKLSGEQAEWFVRFRHEWLQGDIGRVQNQRRFMAAAMKKILSIVKDEGKMKLYSYLKTIYQKKWIATNMSVDDLSKLADFGSTLKMENVSVNMVPGEDAMYYAADGVEYSIYSIHKKATIDMLNENFRPYQLPLLPSESNIIEYVDEYNYQYDLYDDTGATFEELQYATEPLRDPEKAPWWKEYEND
ncbi:MULTISPECIES: LCP family protein [Ruminococcus]|uniref:Transcriptional attenuator, LytR family n=1 Tax=Ruminococcus flavefaciens TaxID=1265 RepID=A0A1M7MEC5_RUMFL|nr:MULTISPECIES: LCP family protein [Ruminococcus]MCR4794622.1 LCP family protein [Ruminococcus sp.]SHM88697.1 transcriptional attenuator, LytR family [Ruminococcus flavefaciens]